MTELEDLRNKKLRELQERYMNGGKTMKETTIAHPVIINDADFEQHLKKYPNLIIDCWAPWCGPCRMLTPIIDELANDLKGKIVFGKLNVDENPQISMKHQIMSIPTLLVFKNGQLIDRLIGAMPKDMLLKRINQHF